MCLHCKVNCLRCNIKCLMHPVDHTHMHCNELSSYSYKITEMHHAYLYLSPNSLW
uniref:Uncharacterized protein n=2 Tax=Anguilla anguilla TaxID=7936 RepID=A0A0E9P683_ANGAN